MFGNHSINKRFKENEYTNEKEYRIQNIKKVDLPSPLFQKSAQTGTINIYTSDFKGNQSVKSPFRSSLRLSAD